MDLISFPDPDPNLKRAQSLVGSSAGRPQYDWYPTPASATEALLRVERFSGAVLEPACGDGAMTTILQRAGLAVTSTDLIDRGFGEGGLDFVSPDYPYRSDNIITNPPFNLAERFIERALERTTAKVCLLAKVQLLEGVRRKALFETTPFKRMWVFSKRLTLTRNGQAMANSGMLCFCWYVWEHGYQGEPMIGWL